MTDLVKRLRERKLFFGNGATWCLSNEPDHECIEAADEIERLTVLLNEKREAVRWLSERLRAVLDDQTKRASRAGDETEIEPLTKLEAEDRLRLIALLAEDRAWDAVVLIGRAFLDHYYPADIFTGASGDTGPRYIVALREALDRLTP
jgi:hypothetical protein